MKIFAPHAADFYKTGHIFQYQPKTEFVYSNFTGRSDKLATMMDGHFDKKVVFIGLQGLIKSFLIESWWDTFFSQPKEQVLAKYQRRMDTSLGPGAVPVEHMAALWELGCLPVRIRALPEGSRVNIGVPMFTIENTIDEFYWVTNYLETAISAEIWKTCTNATIAYEYRKLLDTYADLTGAPKDFVPWQGHDFSARGMSGVSDQAGTGIGHLASFWGTDTILAIDYAEDYYNADCTKELIGGSVPATEHSVMCMGGNESELETFRRLITKVYPSGVVSVVSDTWNYWIVLTVYLPALKEEILARTPDALGLAKVVIRHDSGDPVKGICGHEYKEVTELSRSEFNCTDENVLKYDNRFYEALWDNLGFCSGWKEISETEVKGTIEVLWDLFGGETSSKGYKMLNPRIGMIYGDSITLPRAREILAKLEKKGFASSNIVLGIGSYTYQFVTRDTFGHAIKATYGVVAGEGVELFKDPVTDSGTKKSAKGLLRVEKEGDNFVLYDQQTMEQMNSGAMEIVFENGQMKKETSLAEIRKTLGTFK